MPALLQLGAPARLARVPAFPPAALKLLALVSSEGSSVAELAACVSLDPTIASRLLRRANAADAARVMETRSVADAIVALGLRRTAEIALSTATLAYIGAGARGETETQRRSWRHAVACATLAAEIATLLGLATGEAYTAGLLHDVGRLGLMSAEPAEYERAMASAGAQCADFLEFERERFGLSHTEAGAWLARQWNLPEAVVRAAQFHHEPACAPLDLLAVVQIACPLADALGYSTNAIARLACLDDIAAALPAAVRERLWTRLGHVERAIAEQIAYIEATNEAALVVPCAPRLSVAEDELQALIEDFQPCHLRAVPRYHSSIMWLILLAVVVAVACLAILLRV